MIALLMKPSEGPTDAELMKRWSKLDPDCDPQLYAEFMDYQRWLSRVDYTRKERGAPALKDSPATRRLFLRNKGQLVFP